MMVSKMRMGHNFTWVVVLAALSTFAIIPAHAQTYNVYADPLPEWADYAANVIYESTKSWMDTNPGLEFYQVDDVLDADFHVKWVRDFGGEQLGYAYGRQFIEVGLGDDRCYGTWQPYSARYVTYTMTHEIGHILGLEHSDDINDIMYPISQYGEYGLVTYEETLTTNYASFHQLCTNRPTTTYSYHVATDDPTWGFDVYFVPSIQSLHDWSDGEAFDYYSDEGCYGENYLSYSGTCENVSNESGLLVIMGDRLTNPLTTITVKVEELPQERDALANIPTTSADPKPSQTVFATWMDPMHGFSLDYPESWKYDDSGEFGGLVTFYDGEMYNSRISVYDVSSIINTETRTTLKQEEQDRCNNLTFAADGLTCSNYRVIFEDASEDQMQGSVTKLSYTTTIHYEDPPGFEDFTTILWEVSDGTSSYQLHSDIRSDYLDLHYEDILTSLQSFVIGGYQTESEYTPEPTSVLIQDRADPPYRNTHVPGFPAFERSPAHYIQRYDVELEFREWYDGQFPRVAIEDVVGYAPTHVPGFPDNSKSPKYYIDRYDKEPGYRHWFDSQFPDSAMYDILGIEPHLIPDWFTDVTRWWYDSKIQGDEYGAVILFLANSDMIHAKLGSEATYNEYSLPTRQSVQSWLDEKISDKEFLGDILPHKLD